MYNSTQQYTTSAASQDSLFADSGAIAGFNIAILILGAIFVLLILALAVVSTVSMWKLFAKAGKPGWAAIVPIYKSIVQLQIIGRPLWWVLMEFIPVVNIVFAVLIVLDFAKSYGKDDTYGLLLLLFPVVMLPVLAFSKDTKYIGPVGPERY